MTSVYNDCSSSSILSKGTPSLISNPQSGQSQVDKVNKTSSNIFTSLLTSRILRSSVFSAISLGAFLLLFSNPAVLLTIGLGAGVALTAFTISLLAQGLFDGGAHKIGAEMKNVMNLFRKKTEIDSDVRFKNIDEYHMFMNSDQGMLLELDLMADLINNKKLIGLDEYYITNEGRVAYLIKYENFSLDDAIKDISITKPFARINNVGRSAIEIRDEELVDEVLVDEVIVQFYMDALRSKSLPERSVNALPMKIFEHEGRYLYFFTGKKITSGNFTKMKSLSGINDSKNLSKTLDDNVEKLRDQIMAGNICLNYRDINKDIALTIAAYLIKYENLEYKLAINKVNSIMNNIISEDQMIIYNYENSLNK